MDIQPKGLNWLQRKFYNNTKLEKKKILNGTENSDGTEITKGLTDEIKYFINTCKVTLIRNNVDQYNDEVKEKDPDNTKPRTNEELENAKSDQQLIIAITLYKIIKVIQCGINKHSNIDNYKNLITTDIVKSKLKDAQNELDDEFNIMSKDKFNAEELHCITTKICNFLNNDESEDKKLHIINKIKTLSTYTNPRLFPNNEEDQTASIQELRQSLKSYIGTLLLDNNYKTAKKEDNILNKDKRWIVDNEDKITNSQYLSELLLSSEPPTNPVLFGGAGRANPYFKKTIKLQQQNAKESKNSQPQDSAVNEQANNAGSLKQKRNRISPQQPEIVVNPQSSNVEKDNVVTEIKEDNLLITLKTETKWQNLELEDMKTEESLPTTPIDDIILEFHLKPYKYDDTIGYVEYLNQILTFIHLANSQLKSLDNASNLIEFFMKSFQKVPYKSKAQEFINLCRDFTINDNSNNLAQNTTSMNQIYTKMREYHDSIADNNPFYLTPQKQEIMLADIISSSHEYNIGMYLQRTNPIGIKLLIIKNIFENTNNELQSKLKQACDNTITKILLNLKNMHSEDQNRILEQITDINFTPSSKHIEIIKNILSPSSEGTEIIQRNILNPLEHKVTRINISVKDESTLNLSSTHKVQLIKIIAKDTSDTTQQWIASQIANKLLSYDNVKSLIDTITLFRDPVAIRITIWAISQPEYRQIYTDKYKQITEFLLKVSLDKISSKIISELISDGKYLNLNNNNNNNIKQRIESFIMLIPKLDLSHKKTQDNIINAIFKHIFKIPKISQLDIDTIAKLLKAINYVTWTSNKAQEIIERELIPYITDIAIPGRFWVVTKGDPFENGLLPDYIILPTLEILSKITFNNVEAQILILEQMPRKLFNNTPERVSMIIEIVEKMQLREDKIINLVINLTKYPFNQNFKENATLVKIFISKIIPELFQSKLLLNTSVRSQAFQFDFIKFIEASVLQNEEYRSIVSNMITSNQIKFIIDNEDYQDMPWKFLQTKFLETIKMFTEDPNNDIKKFGFIILENLLINSNLTDAEVQKSTIKLLKQYKLSGYTPTTENKIVLSDVAFNKMITSITSKWMITSAEVTKEIHDYEIEHNTSDNYYFGYTQFNQEIPAPASIITTQNIKINIDTCFQNSGTYGITYNTEGTPELLIVWEGNNSTFAPSHLTHQLNQIKVYSLTNLQGNYTTGYYPTRIDMSVDDVTFLPNWLQEIILANRFNPAKYRYCSLITSIYDLINNTTGIDETIKEIYKFTVGQLFENNGDRFPLINNVEKAVELKKSINNIMTIAMRNEDTAQTIESTLKTFFTIHQDNTNQVVRLGFLLGRLASDIALGMNKDANEFFYMTSMACFTEISRRISNGNHGMILENESQISQIQKVINDICSDLHSGVCAEGATTRLITDGICNDQFDIDRIFAEDVNYYDDAEEKY